MCASDGRMPSTARIDAASMLTTAPDRALPTAVSSERMPTSDGPEGPFVAPGNRERRQPRDDACRRRARAHQACGAGLLPARRARVSPRTHVEPGPRARPMLQHGVPDRRSSIWRPMPAGSAAYMTSAARPQDRRIVCASQVVCDRHSSVCHTLKEIQLR